MPEMCARTLNADCDSRYSNTPPPTELTHVFGYAPNFTCASAAGMLFVPTKLAPLAINQSIAAEGENVSATLYEPGGTLTCVASLAAARTPSVLSSTPVGSTGAPDTPLAAKSSTLTVCASFPATVVATPPVKGAV